MGLISFEEAARRTGTSSWTWRKWASIRRIPTVKLGRRRLVDERVVEAVIRAGEVPADARVALPGTRA